MRHLRAFTLIELLVVISILALLLGILAPSLMKAKEQAKSVYCLSNLRQMAVAAANYNLSNNGRYPIAQYVMEVERTTTAAALSDGAGPADATPPATETVIYLYAWDFTMIRSGGRTRSVPGVLWQGDTIEKVQQCPSYKGSDNWGGIQFTGYNYNTSYIGHGQGELVSPDYSGAVIKHPIWPDWYDIVMPVKEAEVRSPNQCVLFGDGHYSGGANKFMRAPQAWAGDRGLDLKVAGTQGYRHLNKTNVAFCDGHAETQAGLFTDTHPSGKESLDSYNEAGKPKIGFLSSGNSRYNLK